jgi:hypothetical protein
MSGGPGRTAVESLLIPLLYAWGLIGAAAAAVAAFEVLPGLAKRLRHRLKFEHGFKPYFGAFADGYRDEDWPAHAFREFFDRVRVEWAPFVGWRHRPLAGTYHNFDARGLRRTWRPPEAESGGKRPHRVFMLGGSTVMGMGARDDGTVPSLLARGLFEAGLAAEVTNMGQLGYVMAQEVAALIEELKRGNAPDLAVFTDGLNEVMTAEHHGTAGRLWQEANRRHEFNLIQPYRRADLLRFAARALAPETAKALGLFEPPADPPARLAAADVERVAGDVWRHYAWNVRLVEDLAARFKFRALFFWQPAIFMKKTPTAYEERLKREGDTPLFRSVYGQRLETLGTLENAVDLSRAFEDLAEGVYYDAHHLTERGNGLLAAAMLPHVVAALRARGEA